MQNLINSICQIKCFLTNTDVLTNDENKTIKQVGRFIEIYVSKKVFYSILKQIQVNNSRTEFNWTFSLIKPKPLVTNDHWSFEYINHIITCNLYILVTLQNSTQ